MLLMKAQRWRFLNGATCTQVFYAACQALLYILCYRLEQLWKEAEPARSLQSTSPTGVLDSGTREQVTRLFSDIMPQVLNHRCAPMQGLTRPVLISLDAPF